MNRIKESQTLGDKLRKRREELELSITDVAQEIAAPNAVIHAFETNQYDTFHAKVYARGFFKKLCIALAMGDIEHWLREFDTEWHIQHFRDVALPTYRVGTKAARFIITPKRIAAGSAALLFFILALFVGTRLTFFIRTPRLIITNPLEKMILDKPVIRVQGKTEKESQLTVNGREIKIDGSGNFDEEIGLGVGLNTLEFLAENRFGKITNITRYIVVE